MAQESHLMSVARPSASPHDATTARLAEGLPLRPSFPRDYEDLASRPSVVHEKQVSCAQGTCFQSDRILARLTVRYEELVHGK